MNFDNDSEHHDLALALDEPNSDHHDSESNTDADSAPDELDIEPDELAEHDNATATRSSSARLHHMSQGNVAVASSSSARSRRVGSRRGGPVSSVFNLTTVWAGSVAVVRREDTPVPCLISVCFFFHVARIVLKCLCMLCPNHNYHC